MSMLIREARGWMSMQNRKKKKETDSVQLKKKKHRAVRYLNYTYCNADYSNDHSVT